MKKKVLDIGTYEKGDFSCRIDGKTTKEYNSWINILRKYNENNICKRWLNFQDFATDLSNKENYDEWASTQYKFSILLIDDSKPYCDENTKIDTISVKNKKFVSDLYERGTVSVKLRNKNTGEVRVVENIKDFCKEVGFLNSRLYELKNGKRKSYKGWVLAD